MTQNIAVAIPCPDCDGQIQVNGEAALHAHSPTCPRGKFLQVNILLADAYRAEREYLGLPYIVGPPFMEALEEWLEELDPEKSNELGPKTRDILGSAANLASGEQNE